MIPGMKSAPIGCARETYSEGLRSILDKGASSTVIVKLALPVCPAEFVAEHVIEWTPTESNVGPHPLIAGNVSPPELQVTVRFPSTSSVAVGGKFCVFRIGLPAVIVMSFGTDTSIEGEFIVNDSCIHMSYSGAHISKVQVPYIKLLVGEINPPWL